MRWKYAVTFESTTQPPRTFRGEVESTGPGAATRRAVDKAKKEKGKSGWESICVLLEKPQEALAASTSDSTDESDEEDIV